MDGVSYPKNAQIGREELSYLRVLHTGFDEKTYVGELVVNQKDCRRCLRNHERTLRKSLSDRKDAAN